MRSETFRAPGLVLTEHELEVPLDHAAPEGERITIFAREVADPDGGGRPFLVFFQGGPGGEALRPAGFPVGPAWLVRALRDFRVLLLDQRGTGRSTPVMPGWSAERLAHLRADAIVRDAELLREALGAGRWSVLGQSFGGFCVLRYLTVAPDALREALITGGLPPVGRAVDDVYRATWARMLERNRRYYARYPGDRARVLALLERLDSDDLRLPSGDRLTGRRLRQLGIMLGMSDGAERVHHLLELAPDSPMFLHDLESANIFARNPLYAVVHESSYADGGTTRWAAQRTMPEEFAERPELLFGEHVFPWMLEDYGGLHGFRDAAEALAAREWPRLYDAARLREADVPVAAAIYAEDPYVERAFSEETAALLPGMRAWLTSEYDHDAIRADGGRVLGRLIDLARGRA